MQASAGRAFELTQVAVGVSSPCRVSPTRVVSQGCAPFALTHCSPCRVSPSRVVSQGCMLRPVRIDPLQDICLVLVLATASKATVNVHVYTVFISPGQMPRRRPAAAWKVWVSFRRNCRTVFQSGHAICTVTWEKHGHLNPGADLSEEYGDNRKEGALPGHRRNLTVWVQSLRSYTGSTRGHSSCIDSRMTHSLRSSSWAYSNCTGSSHKSHSPPWIPHKSHSPPWILHKSHSPPWILHKSHSPLWSPHRNHSWSRNRLAHSSRRAHSSWTDSRMTHSLRSSSWAYSNCTERSHSLPCSCHKSHSPPWSPHRSHSLPCSCHRSHSPP
uniref:Uncharacterized protein n=1 Tax=Callithrix jacchus TaxID=9483 RepID=A0A8I3X829_CALJA